MASSTGPKGFFFRAAVRRFDSATSAGPKHTLSVERNLLAKPEGCQAPVGRKQRSREIVYLAEMHSLQVVPGSLLLSKDPEKPIPEENDGRFVAVGDPVTRCQRVRGAQ